MANRQKDFSGINTGRIYSQIEQATHAKGEITTASPQEQQERAENLRTQGRKGCKAVRINMAFTPSNHEFIKVMAKATGHTMTEICNIIVEAYRKEHPDYLEYAAKFLDFVNGGNFYGFAAQSSADEQQNSTTRTRSNKKKGEGK